ncbi:MAG TPA: DMT family transporter [Gemmatimonadaceae bacterium]|nr:DMT family transporter [Gemmatimonadaceae bacterium]
MTAPAPSRAAAGRATLLIAMSACGFGAIAILVTIAQATGAPLLTLLAGRYVLGGLVLGALAAAGGTLVFDRATLGVTAFAGIGQVAVSIISLSALQFIPAATLSFLFYTYPAWIAIIAKFRHSEPLTPLRLTALGLSLAGIFVMVGAPGTTSLHPAGVALALGAALIYAAYVPIISELERGRAPMAMATYMSAGAAVILLVAGGILGELTVALHRTAWIAILLLGMVSTVGAFLGFLRGLRVLGPVRTAIVSTVEPFFTAVLGAWLLAQPITRTTLMGGALIAAAVILLQLRTAK